MLPIFGLKKNLTKAYKKFGLNTRKQKLFFNIKQKNNLKIFFIKKFLGKSLKKKIKDNIDFIIKQKTFKGIRHKLGYPALGQRTHTNAKTKKKFRY